jgi:hypothetical protein
VGYFTNCLSVAFFNAVYFYTDFVTNNVLLLVHLSLGAGLLLWKYGRIADAGRRLMARSGVG